MDLDNTFRFLTVKSVDGVETLFRVSKDSIRKIPVVEELPYPTESREGLTVLYDDGNGMSEYLCVRTADNSYTWISATALRNLIPWDEVEHITTGAEITDNYYLLIYGNQVEEDGGMIIINDPSIEVDSGMLIF